MVTSKGVQFNQDEFQRTTNIEIPLSFVAYANLDQGTELSVLLKTTEFKEGSSEPSLLSGYLQIEQVSEFFLFLLAQKI